MTVLGKLISLNIAKTVSVPYGSKEVETGIFKTSSTMPLMLTRTGLIGDQQADLVNHGGPDKAVCVYSADHFPYWEKEWGEAGGSRCIRRELYGTRVDGGYYAYW